MASDSNKGVYVLSETTTWSLVRLLQIFLAGMVTVTCFTTAGFVSTSGVFHSTFLRFQHRSMQVSSAFWLRSFAIATTLAWIPRVLFLIASLDDSLPNHITIMLWLIVNRICGSFKGRMQRLFSWQAWCFAKSVRSVPFKFHYWKRGALLPFAAQSLPWFDCQ